MTDFLHQMNSKIEFRSSYMVRLALRRLYQLSLLAGYRILEDADGILYQDGSFRPPCRLSLTGAH